MKKTAKTIGIILLLLFIYFAAQCLSGVGLSIAYIIRNVFSAVSDNAPPDAADIITAVTDYMSKMMTLILLISVAVASLFYYLIYKNRKADLRRFCTFRSLGSVGSVSLIVFSLTLGIVLDFVLSALISSGAASDAAKDYGNVTDMLFAGGSFIPTLIVTGIVVPIFEEFLFRGLIFGELRKVTDVRMAIAVQALIFGLYHFNLIQSSYAFLLGLILGYLYYRSSSLLSTITVHIIFNASNIVVYYLINEEQLSRYGIYIYSAAIVLLIASSVVMLMNTSFKHRMDKRLPVSPPNGVICEPLRAEVPQEPPQNKT